MKISKYTIQLTNLYYFYLLVFIFKSTLKNFRFRWVGLETGIVNDITHIRTYVANIKQITFSNTHILIYTKTDDYLSLTAQTCADIHFVKEGR